MAQENVMCPFHPVWWRSLFLIMEARLVVLESRLKRTEEVLVMVRLGQRFAESAEQVVGTQSAGIEKSLAATGLVGAKETGEPPTSNGESGLSSQAGGHGLAPVEFPPLELSWRVRARR